MSVGQASGLALVAAAAAGCEVAQYTANEVKQGLVGYGAATKEQVQRMGGPGARRSLSTARPTWPMPLALAVCHLDDRAVAPRHRYGALGWTPMPTDPSGTRGVQSAELVKDEFTT